MKREEELNMTREKWPPIDPGTRVRTTQPNLAMRDEWTEKGWASKKPDMSGKVLRHHDCHGLCYDILHDDGTEGSYDPSEFVVIS